MRFFLLFVLHFLIVLSAGAAPRCPDPAVLLNGPPQDGLTNYWHLEYIGADFAKQHLEKIQTVPITSVIYDSLTVKNRENLCPRIHRTEPDQLVSDAKILEWKFDLEIIKNHPYAVQSMLAGPLGASSNVNLTGNVANYTKSSDYGLKELEAVTANNAKVINFSMTLQIAKFQGISKFLKFRDLAGNGVIIVTSSGNDSATDPDLEMAKRIFPGIVVGAIDPTGYKTALSQDSNKVAVLAPGDDVPTKDRNGKITKRSGTSYAAPLVSGSVVNVLSILPELTLSSVELLIAKTGTPLPTFEKNKTNKKIINSYKMVRVTERLRDYKQKKNISLLNFEALRALLEDPKFLDFKSETDALEDQANKITSNDCAANWEKIKLLREAFLLNPSESVRKSLSRLYSDVGYFKNSLFYSNLEKK